MKARYDIRISSSRSAAVAASSVRICPVLDTAAILVVSLCVVILRIMMQFV